MRLIYISYTIIVSIIMMHVVSVLLYRDISEHIINIHSEIDVLQKKINYTRDIACSADIQNNQERARNSKKIILK